MKLHRYSTKPLVFGLLFLLLPSAGVAQAAGATNASQEELQRTIRQYILDHPEVVLESVHRFQQREEAAQKERSRAAVNAHRRELDQGPSSKAADLTKANKEAVTIVSFFDYRCGYCKKVSDTVSRLAAAPGIRIVYKDLPILGPESVLAAQAALAAEKQGKYQEFHRALLSAAGSINAGVIEQIAAKLNLDVTRLKKDMSAPEVDEAIKRNRQLAEELGVQSTPTFIIGADILPGALSEEAFNAAIHAARTQPNTTQIQAQAHTH